MIKDAVSIPLEHVSIKKNSYLGNNIDPVKPVNAVIFPYSQHFIIKQDLKKYAVKNQKDLVLQTKSFLSKTGFKTMSYNMGRVTPETYTRLSVSISVTQNIVGHQTKRPT